MTVRSDASLSPDYSLAGANRRVRRATSVVTGATDLRLEWPAGNVPGIYTVNKFGRATNCDTGIDTDVYDRANPTDDVPIWVAPTASRVHAIVSTSADDTDTTGASARTIRVRGLTDWDTSEVDEVVSLNGTTPVNTVNSYVMIDRMEVVTSGGTAINAGTITATAATDGTVTAQMQPLEGQSQMAIYGIPSIQTAYLTGYYACALKPASAATVSVSLRVNVDPAANVLNFIDKHLNGLDTAAVSYMLHRFEPFYAFPGPCIIKVQVNSSANNVDVSAGFDILVVDN